ncbi:MAG: polysulfide reductase NrfD, partial [bacterium]|nr:polysulfide reductase NrfD [bacterium]
MADSARGELLQITPDAVAASLARGDGGFGRDQRSYYDHPVLRGAHWRWEIIWYFYIGGLMSGSAILASAADTFGGVEDRDVVRNGRLLALLGAAVSPLLLIKDLGRPDRFLHMTRILKLKSPMSVGVWSLITFSTFSAIAALEEMLGRGHVPWLLGGLLPRGARNLFHALAAAFTGSYTGVLI